MFYLSPPPSDLVPSVFWPNPSNNKLQHPHCHTTTLPPPQRHLLQRMQTCRTHTHQDRRGDIGRTLEGRCLVTTPLQQKKVEAKGKKSFATEYAPTKKKKAAHTPPSPISARGGQDESLASGSFPACRSVALANAGSVCT